MRRLGEDRKRRNVSTNLGCPSRHRRSFSIATSSVISVGQTPSTLTLSRSKMSPLRINSISVCSPARNTWRAQPDGEVGPDGADCAASRLSVAPQYEQPRLVQLDPGPRGEGQRKAQTDARDDHEVESAEAQDRGPVVGGDRDGLQGEAGENAPGARQDQQVDQGQGRHRWRLRVPRSTARLRLACRTGRFASGREAHPTGLPVPGSTRDRSPRGRLRSQE